MELFIDQQHSPFPLKSRFLKAAAVMSPTNSSLDAGLYYSESDSDIVFSKSTAFRAAIITVCLLLMLLVCIARRESILQSILQCLSLVATRPPVRQQQHLSTELEKVWSKRAVIDAVPIMTYSQSHHQLQACSTAECCMICLNEFSEGELIRALPSCTHHFHVRCIDLWFACHVSCPICRKTCIAQNLAASSFKFYDIPAAPVALGSPT